MDLPKVTATNVKQDFYSVLDQIEDTGKGIIVTRRDNKTHAVRDAVMIIPVKDGESDED